MAIGNFSPLLSNRIKPKNPKGLDEVRVISVRERKTDKHDNPSEAFPKTPQKVFSPHFLAVLQNVVSLHAICGADRLNRESGVNPVQFPLL